MDAAKKAGAIKLKKPSTVKRKMPWFDNECVWQRTKYKQACKLANATNQKVVKTNAFKRYKKVLRQEKDEFTNKTNLKLHSLYSSDPKEYWQIIKSFSHKQNTCTADLTYMFTHFRK